MCEYCKNVITGNDYKAIVEDEGETYNGIIFFDASIGIVYKNNYPVLKMDANLMNSPIMSKYTSITFCPMCGCNLRKAIEERRNKDE